MTPGKIASAENSRRSGFKKGHDADEGRRRREEVSRSIRKKTKEEALAMRRTTPAKKPSPATHHSTSPTKSESAIAFSPKSKAAFSIGSSPRLESSEKAKKGKKKRTPRKTPGRQVVARGERVDFADVTHRIMSGPYQRWEGELVSEDEENQTIVLRLVKNSRGEKCTDQNRTVRFNRKRSYVLELNSWHMICKLSQEAGDEEEDEALKLFEMGKWDCPKCGKKNGNSAGYCNARKKKGGPRCGGAKQAEKKLTWEGCFGPTKEKTWQCDGCLGPNKMADNVCVACKAPKPDEAVEKITENFKGLGSCGSSGNQAEGEAEPPKPVASGSIGPGGFSFAPKAAEKEVGEAAVGEDSKLPSKDAEE